MQEERLPLWLRPYEVLVTSARTALIEFVPNTASIHAIKAKSPPRTSLRDHYLARFGPVVSAAQYPRSAFHCRPASARLLCC